MSGSLYNGDLASPRSDHARTRAVVASGFVVCCAGVLAWALMAIGTSEAADSARSPLAGSGSYRVYLKSDMEALREATWEVRVIGEELLYSAEGQGRYANHPESVSWSVTARFSVDDPTQLRESERIVVSRDDPPRVLRVIRRTFDPDRGVLTVAITEPRRSEDPVVHQFTGLREVATRETLTFVIRRWLLAGSPPQSFALVTDEPQLHRIRPVVRGQEQVTVPDGTFSCLKVQLMPDLGWLQVFGQFFAPKLLLWHTLERPHYWVQYDGLEGGLHTRRVVIERTALAVYEMTDEGLVVRDLHDPSTH